MAIDRRRFLTAGAASVAGCLLTPHQAGAGKADRTREALFAANRRAADGGFSAAIFRADGTDVNAVALPARGHDVTVCPVTRTCVAFARRPGNFAVAFRADRRWKPVRFTTPPDRHFYGHGIFSPDGRILFATENDFEAGEGRIGVYDVGAGYVRKGELSTHGVGPHDVALLPGGRVLVVANGGIETHPGIGGGRTKLNIATMSPSLVYLDAKDGRLIERHALPAAFHKLSLRHLDIGKSRTLVIGGQLQNGAPLDAPLIARHRLGEDLEPVELAPDVQRSLRGYISSVAVDHSGEIAALTASRGGRVVFVDVATGLVKGYRELTDVSGVAPAPSGFLLTTGKGLVAMGAASARTDWNWDNHAVRCA